MIVDNIQSLQLAWAGIIAYVALIAAKLLFGKRPVGRLRLVDLVGLAAVGATLLAMMLQDHFSVTASLFLLCLLLLSPLRSRKASSSTSFEPMLLVHRGKVLPQALQRSGLSEAQIVTAVQARGYASLETVQSIVLQPDGDLTLVEPTGRTRPLMSAELASLLAHRGK